MDLLQSEPDLSQRKIAERLEISLGHVNFFLKSFVGQALVERVGQHGQRAHHSESYLLTEKGRAARTALGSRVLPFKLAEFNRLRVQIARLSEPSGTE